MRVPGLVGTGLAVREPLQLGAPAPVLAVGSAGLAVGTAVIGAVLGRTEIVSWPLEVAAVVAIVLAGGVVVWRTNPFRAPFRARAHAGVLGAALIAVLLDQTARAGRDLAVHDDWAVVVLPLFLLVIATLRPTREVFAGGIVATLATAVAVLLTSDTTDPAATGTRVAIAVTQVLPPALAATALARTAIRRLASAAAPGPPAVGDAVRLSVRQETIARLEAEAVPLMSTIAGAGRVTQAQIDRARTIAAGLRAALVADLSRGWLTEAGFAVDDPDGYADRMTAAQRTALRTTVASLPLADFERPGTASITGQDLHATLTMTLPVSDPPRRGRIAPLVPLLRAVFSRAEVHLQPDRVVLVAELGEPG